MAGRVARVLMALFISPLAAVIPLIVVAGTQRLWNESRYVGFDEWALIAIFAIAISYVCTLVIGLPAYLLLSYLDRYSVRSIVVTGFIVAFVPSAVYAFNAHISEDVLFASLYVACAVSVSYVFGIITFRK